MKNRTCTPHIFKSVALKGFLVLFLLTGGVFRASAQKSTVISTLSKYGIDPSFLDPVNLRTPADQVFDLKESTTVAGKTKVILAKFDPSATGRDQWKVIAVDGKTPSLYESNTFGNTRTKTPVDKPDEKTYKIDSETEEQMVISYKLDETCIPMDARFLKDCRVLLTVDLKNKHLKQLQLVNEMPVKIGPIAVEKFQIITTYVFDKLSGRYFPINDDLNMEGAFLGKNLTTRIETVYTNYAGKH